VSDLNPQDRISAKSEEVIVGAYVFEPERLPPEPEDKIGECVRYDFAERGGFQVAALVGGRGALGTRSGDRLDPMPFALEWVGRERNAGGICELALRLYGKAVAPELRAHPRRMHLVGRIRALQRQCAYGDYVFATAAYFASSRG
jgi:hypothetical protein